jgi:riboflavin biosynthesis pyrimidine reductase
MTIETLLVEGGGYVITSFLRARVVDRLVVTVCPRIIGSGLDSVGQLDVLTVEQALRIRKMQTYNVGEDYVLIGEPEL